MGFWPRLAPALALLTAAAPAGAYPLDGFPLTGIKRLEAYRLAAQGGRRPSFLTEGEMLPAAAIRLGLLERPEMDLPSADEGFSQELRAMLGRDAGAYGVSVLDFTDAKHPRYAAHNADNPQNPGSVGKIAVLLAWFQALADVHPDVKDRQRLLHDTWIEADEFVLTDSHDVPLWDFDAAQVEKRPIAVGDRANLWTFFDWMVSASSNAAASTLIEQLVLLRHFGRAYPVPKPQADAWLRETPQAELSKILTDALISPLGRSDLDASKLRQGSFFTREGKRRIPGTNSTSTASELMQYIVRMEQGRLVDRYSSLEIKKLLYLTDARIRYAAHPALADSAVYFKSGSLYSCAPERGYTCEKFKGNRLNFMNSMVVVESIERQPQLRYAVVVLSNVLRRNSSEAHQDLAQRIHALMEERHPLTGLDAATNAGR